MAELTRSERMLVDGVLCGPHCYARILHAPGECEYCDRFPFLQLAREMWGINYTGHYEPDRQPCPADAARGDNHQAWPGNRPVPIT